MTDFPKLIYYGTFYFSFVSLVVPLLNILTCEFGEAQDTKNLVNICISKCLFELQLNQLLRISLFGVNKMSRSKPLLSKHSYRNIINGPFLINNLGISLTILIWSFSQMHRSSVRIITKQHTHHTRC